MTQSYSVRLRCPYGDTDTWMLLENRSETLEGVLKSSWDFECDAHGVQREIPMDAKPVESVPPPALEPAQTRPREPKTQLDVEVSSGDRPVCVAVVVYGWSKNHGTFHEETSTIQANASGALLSLTTKLEIGESCFLLNKATRKEKEVRVVHVDPEMTGETHIALTFQQPDTDFWKPAKGKPRVPVVYRVQVTGVDRNNNPFTQSVYTVNISKNGARLDGGSQLTRPGQVIEVRRRWHGKARYRVVWVGQIGFECANHIGICCLEPDKNIWGVALPEPDTDEPERDSTPREKNTNT